MARRDKPNERDQPADPEVLRFKPRTPPRIPAPRCECGAPLYVYDSADIGPELICPNCTAFELGP
jgi:hypothetical protein